MSRLRYVPSVHVLDEDGKSVLDGYYCHHTDTSVCFAEDDKPEYHHELVVHDSFADWGMKQDVRLTKVTAPHTIEVDTDEGDEFVLKWLGLNPEAITVAEVKNVLKFVKEAEGPSQLVADYLSMNTSDVLLDHVAKKLGISVQGCDFEDSVERIDCQIDKLMDK